MHYWLVKSEPSVYSWDQFVKEGETDWTGVRNYAARNHLRSMKKGDPVLFYHSNEGLEIVGIAKVSKEAFQDPTTDDPNWASLSEKMPGSTGTQPRPTFRAPVRTKRPTGTGKHLTAQSPPRRFFPAAFCPGSRRAGSTSTATNSTTSGCRPSN